MKWAAGTSTARMTVQLRCGTHAHKHMLAPRRALGGAISRTFREYDKQPQAPFGDRLLTTQGQAQNEHVWRSGSFTRPRNHQLLPGNREGQHFHLGDHKAHPQCRYVSLGAAALHVQEHDVYVWLRDIWPLSFVFVEVLKRGENDSQRRCRGPRLHRKSR